MTDEDVDHDDMFSIGSVSIRELLAKHKSLATAFAPYDRLRLASTFGALLARSELLANSHRLEVLVHLALLTAEGTKKPDDRIVELAFNGMSETFVGLREDPSEDVAVHNIGTDHGNFRMLGGTWESGGFYLQRLVSTLEGLGDSGLIGSLRSSAIALLRLSEEVCRRAGLVRNHLGPEMPIKTLPRAVRSGSGGARRLVRFSIEEVQALGIDLDDLAPFGFRAKLLSTLQTGRVGHSLLERFPLILGPDALYFVLPTSAGTAITRLVVENLQQAGALRPFAAALADNYGSLFSRTPILDERSVSVEFRGAPGGLAGAAMMEIDHGLYLNLIFVADDLQGFTKDGVLGFFPSQGDWDKLVDHWVQQSWGTAQARPDYVGGLTLVVLCGIGRGVPHFLLDAPREGWRTEMISAPDLLTLSWLPDFKALSLWRILEASDRLEALGVGLHNFNGLVNLVGWARELGGHLVPHASLPSELGTASALVWVRQNGLRDVRHEALTQWDAHMAMHPSGEWRPVRRDEHSMFAEDRSRPFYMVDAKPDGQWPQGVFETASRRWWCMLETSPQTKGHVAFELMRLIRTWVTRFAKVLDRAFPALGSEVTWKLSFAGDTGDHPSAFGKPRLTYADALDLVTIKVGDGDNICEVVAGIGFEDAFRHPENIAERALMQRTVEGFAAVAGSTLDEAMMDGLLKIIVPDIHARSQHGFMAHHFRDYVRDTVWGAPIAIDTDDGAFLRLGLGWRFRDRVQGDEIVGKDACMAFLNKVVSGLEDEICREMAELDRDAVLDFLLLNHESAVADRNNWHITAAAVLALHDDKTATIDVMTTKDFEFSAIIQSARLLVEFALGEAKAGSGRKPGHLLMSRLMAKVMMIVKVGGWSDAIRWDAMEPRLRISPLGDVLANLSFQEDVLEPFGRRTSEQRFAESMQGYGDKVEDPALDDAPLPIDDDFPPEFWEAWQEQFGASIEAIRALISLLDDLGIDRHQAIYRIKRSELLAEAASREALATEATTLIDALLFKPRASWRTPPSGFEARDIFPWRFRRRLSILRRPMIQVDDLPDPTILIAPGAVEDAFRYMLGCYHRGDFNRYQLSPKMKRWAGKSADRRGHQFAVEVAARMRALGWETRSEVRITALLGRGFPIDYGDVDVLAWNAQTGRVLIIECKDVQFRKTDGEIAEQLADFRGVEVEGKRDLLLKHLDRLAIVRAHPELLTKSLNLTVDPVIEGQLVFRHSVPMQFAWEQLRTKTELHIFDDLGAI